ncbi:hypothetical protein [Rhizobium sp. RU36D]|uniref:hypothetical protein n=1 Tax=Rhizobium sp. RU36D TaxID=1907415 RepID=UPI001179A8AB|nr:hypothetical protein [Rhizobium sp. RU36D]
MLATMLAVGCSAWVIRAEETPPNLVGLLTVRGQCLKVSIARDDLTGRCTGELGMAVYADGRTGFHFMMRSRHIFTVSGIHSKQQSNAVQVDRIVLNDGLETNKPEVIAAEGSCTYGDPYRGRMTVRCAGKLGRLQDFVASFETDGTPPTE